MITKRDRDILIWIERYRSITINQCAKIFFTNNKEAYDQARKRLRHLNKEGLIRRYRKDPRSEVVYFMDKKLKTHDLKIFDVVAQFIYLGWEIEEFEKEYAFNLRDRKYISDAKIIFTKDNKKIPVILEIDYSHMTGKSKIEDITNAINNKHVFLVVRLTQENANVQFLSDDAMLVYLPWNLSGLDRLLCPAIG